MYRSYHVNVKLFQSINDNTNFFFVLLQSCNISLFLCTVLPHDEFVPRVLIIHCSDYSSVPLCCPGNGQCSPGENSRMLADVSTPNGKPVPQGPNSPSGECSQDVHFRALKVTQTRPYKHANKACNRSVQSFARGPITPPQTEFEWPVDCLITPHHHCSDAVGPRVFSQQLIWPPSKKMFGHPDIESN